MQESRWLRRGCSLHSHPTEAIVQSHARSCKLGTARLHGIDMQRGRCTFTTDLKCADASQRHAVRIELVVRSSSCTESWTATQRRNERRHRHACLSHVSHNPSLAHRALILSERPLVGIKLHLLLWHLCCRPDRLLARRKILNIGERRLSQIASLSLPDNFLDILERDGWHETL